jgi:hypothetical protein
MSKLPSPRCTLSSIHMFATYSLLFFILNTPLSYYLLFCNLYSTLRNMALPVSLSNILLFSHPNTYNKHSLKIFTPNARNNNFFNTHHLVIFLMFAQTSLHTSTSLMYPRSKTLQLPTFSHLAFSIFCGITFNLNDFKWISQEYFTLCSFLIESKAVGLIPLYFVARSLLSVVWNL